ncbi:MAG: hypothetical protein K2Y40_08150 [Reyranella sp.]|jgi:hypothetical protein|nr:hypothetical protein [Reyranella sp.]
MRLGWLKGWFDAPTAARDRPLFDLSRFDMGGCPGCRGLRTAASLRCSHCGDTRPVIGDV